MIWISATSFILYALSRTKCLKGSNENMVKLVAKVKTFFQQVQGRIYHFSTPRHYNIKHYFNIGI